MALKVLLVLCGIWSLDFFRSVIPPFCVSSNTVTVHALALEYLVAFYPIFLIIHVSNSMTTILDQLFGCGSCFTDILFTSGGQSWDSKASIINAFTTFLLLTFSKVLYLCHSHCCTSFISTIILVVQGSRKVCFFNSRMLHTGALYICSSSYLRLGSVYSSPTILLILYPTRLFRKCVSCCGFCRWHALHVCGIISGTVQGWN